jgi:hypothetical protein
MFAGTLLALSIFRETRAGFPKGELEREEEK